MPTSHPKIISPVMEKVLEIKPKKVLDLGIGFGKWGSLVREYADIWWWRFYKGEWAVQIDGIEVHEKYRSPNWGNYSHVFIGEIQEILPSMPKYDLIIMLEVLEHIEKAEALYVLEGIFERCNKAIISFTNTHQGNVRDNPYEDHVSQWNLGEFDQYGKVQVLHQDSDGAVLYIEKQSC